MLRALKDIFDNFASQGNEQSSAQLDHALQLASAVLLVEVMRADSSMDAAERKTVVLALKNEFSLSETELEQLVLLAQTQAKVIYDYQRFTGLLNDHFTQDRKIALVESMWKVAYADRELDAHEHHVISKVAGLLHVTHGQYIGAKMRAREATKI